MKWTQQLPNDTSSSMIYIGVKSMWCFCRTCSLTEWQVTATQFFLRKAKNYNKEIPTWLPPSLEMKSYQHAVIELWNCPCVRKYRLNGGRFSRDRRSQETKFQVLCYSDSCWLKLRWSKKETLTCLRSATDFCMSGSARLMQFRSVLEIGLSMLGLSTLSLRLWSLLDLSLFFCSLLVPDARRQSAEIAGLEWYDGTIYWMGETEEEGWWRLESGCKSAWQWNPISIVFCLLIVMSCLSILSTLHILHYEQCFLCLIYLDPTMDGSYFRAAKFHPLAYSLTDDWSWRTIIYVFLCMRI